MRATDDRRRFLQHTAAGGLAMALGPAAHAQAQGDWPQAPVKLIVPFPAGGATDILARLIGKGLSARLGQQLIVDNRAGAGGMIGTTALAKAAPDGYTFGIVIATTVINAPFLYEKVPYDTERDITLVTQLATVPMVLAVHPSVPVSTAPELMQYIKSNKGKLSYGSVATGHYGHVASEFINTSQDGGMVHVPYKGEAPMLQDLLAGQLPLSFVTIATAKPQVEAGKLRLLAITGTRRHPSMPQVPTFAEQGLDADVLKMNPGWIGIGAPAKTPPAIVRRMATEMVAAAREPDVADRILALGMDFVGGTPEAFAEVYRVEKPVWQKLLKGAGIRPE